MLNLLPSYNMSIQNILILTVLMTLGTFTSIQAEVIRGVDIPRLNTEKVTGKWYLLASIRDDDELGCTSDMVERLTDDSYSMKTTFTLTPEARKNNPELPDHPMESTVTVTMPKDSNIMMAGDDTDYGRAMVMFDIDYDSYMAIYSSDTKEKISTGTDGYVFIVGRQKTLPDGLLDKVKQSKFFKEGVKSGSKLRTLNTSNC